MSAGGSYSGRSRLKGLLPGLCWMSVAWVSCGCEGLAAGPSDFSLSIARLLGALPAPRTVWSMHVLRPQAIAREYARDCSGLEQINGSQQEAAANQWSTMRFACNPTSPKFTGHVLSRTPGSAFADCGRLRRRQTPERPRSCDKPLSRVECLIADRMLVPPVGYVTTHHEAAAWPQQNLRKCDGVAHAQTLHSTLPSSNSACECCKPQHTPGGHERTSNAAGPSHPLSSSLWKHSIAGPPRLIVATCARCIPGSFCDLCHICSPCARPSHERAGNRTSARRVQTLSR